MQEMSLIPVNSGLPKSAELLTFGVTFFGLDRIFFAETNSYGPMPDIGGAGAVEIRVG